MTPEAIQQVWTLSLVIFAVVLVVVAVLLTLILVTAKRIHAGVSAIWTSGQKVANNTVQLALLQCREHGLRPEQLGGTRHRVGEHAPDPGAFRRSSAVDRDPRTERGERLLVFVAEPGQGVGEGSIGRVGEFAEGLLISLDRRDFPAKQGIQSLQIGVVGGNGLGRGGGHGDTPEERGEFEQC